MAIDTNLVDHETPIGPVPVSAEEAELRPFAEAVGLPSGVIPLTFPIRWLALPRIRRTVEAVIGLNPVHVSQSFEFGAGLASGCNYTVHVSIQPDADPAQRVVLRNRVVDENDRTVVRFDTILLRTATMNRAPTPAPPPTGANLLPDIAIGAIDQSQVRRYAEAAHDDSALHADPAFARSLGLDQPIVHGMLVMGLFQKALRAWSLPGKVARLFALFTQPIPIGSRIVIGGRLVKPATSPGAERQVVRLFVRDERNDAVCIGEATLVSARPAAL